MQAQIEDRTGMRFFNRKRDTIPIHMDSSNITDKCVPLVGFAAAVAACVPSSGRGSVVSDHETAPLAEGVKWSHLPRAFAWDKSCNMERVAEDIAIPG